MDVRWLCLPLCYGDAPHRDRVLRSIFSFLDKLQELFSGLLMLCAQALGALYILMVFGTLFEVFAFAHIFIEGFRRVLALLTILIERAALPDPPSAHAAQVSIMNHVRGIS